MGCPRYARDAIRSAGVSPARPLKSSALGTFEPVISLFNLGVRLPQGIGFRRTVQSIFENTQKILSVHRAQHLNLRRQCGSWRGMISDAEFCSTFPCSAMQIHRQGSSFNQAPAAAPRQLTVLILISRV
jgi:hypothetical protein